MPCETLSQEVAMSLWQFVVSKTQRSLPTAEQTITENGRQAALTRKWRKFVIVVFLENFGKGSANPHSVEDRAKFGKYGNSAALKMFRVDFPELGESTIRSFKAKYISVLQEKESIMISHQSVLFPQRSEAVLFH